MMITKFDWAEFTVLSVPREKITFSPFSIGSTGTQFIHVSYGNDKNDADLHLPSNESLKEILASRIDLQFCLLQSICGQSTASIFIDSHMSKSNLFQTVLPFSFCYRFVRFEQHNGILWGIVASGLNTNARKIFISVFRSKQLNPFISICASR